MILLLLACAGGKPPEDDTGETTTPYVTPVVDADGDGYPADIDCDDDDRAVNPDAPEMCNDEDDDCDGAIDEDAVDLSTWYPDDDGDGYGPDEPVSGCDVPETVAKVPGDCDDTDADVNPRAQETCDPLDVDEDCDGDRDDGDRNVSGQTDWYRDGDGDGYGAGDPTTSCDAPDGTVDDGTDCDDSTAGVNPGVVEVPDNGVDDDCDAATPP